MSQGTRPAAGAGTVRLGELTVNRMAFGAMRVTGPGVWGAPNNPSAMRRLIVRAFELGHDFFDTADSYGPEVSEKMIADALYPYPAGLVIGTKGGFTRPNRSWVPDGRPEHLRRALEGSLRRLRLERIDLYQFHTPDPKVPFAESVSALADLQKSGKIRHLGLSSVSVAQLEQARRIAPVVSVQNRYNVGDRASDDVLAACEKAGIAFIPWYPLGAGQALRSANVKRIAASLGATASQVALAWLLARSPAMMPIPGTSSLSHLEENAAAANLKLPPADIATLDEA